jgi:hypothetical protein
LRTAVITLYALRFTHDASSAEFADEVDESKSMC